jgi:hypothetical protein
MRGTQAADGEPVPVDLQAELLGLVSFRDMTAPGLERALASPLAAGALLERILDGLWERTSMIGRSEKIVPVYGPRPRIVRCGDR